MLSKMIGASLLSKYIKEEEIGTDESQDEQGEDEHFQQNSLYSWTFESHDLGQLIIGLRVAQHIAYSYKILDEYSVEITAKGEVVEEEINEISKVLGVPKNMVQFRFQPWNKTLIIKTEHKLITSISPIIKTFEHFKLLCFHLAVFQENTSISL
jgi:hypothetical protein